MQIPGTSFMTPKVHRTVYANDLVFQSEGEYTTDYLTIQHSSGLQLQDEFILIGEDHVINDSPYYNYSVHSLREEEETKRRRATVHEIDHNVFVASTQFQRPFDYSTSNWVTDGDNPCEKDTSRFRSLQRMYEEDPQPVSVTTHYTDDPKRYFLKSSVNGPFIKLNIPGICTQRLVQAFFYW